MITKATLSALTLALVLGAAVSGCSKDDQGLPEPTVLHTTAPTGDGSSTTITSEPAAPEPATSEPSEPASSPSPSTSPAPKPTVGSVSVLISNSEWDAATGVTVRGYANTVDADATCTLELIKADVKRSVTSEALESPTTMSCGELTVDAADLSPGDWTAVLSYESTTAWGTSAPVTVNVP